MAKEGLGYIIAVLLFAGLVSLSAVVNPGLPLKVSAFLCWLLFLIIVYFFRDPRRQPPARDNVIVAAADGRVIDIHEVKENEFLQAPATQISIFLSILDVHVNRVPMSGRVAYFDYRKGRFAPAYRKEASLRNEHTLIGIENDKCRILIKQIAGTIARRIVCNVQKGSRVKCGEKFGMIKFGSRVEMVLPKNVRVVVEPNTKVKGGETIIGELLQTVKSGL